MVADRVAFLATGHFAPIAGLVAGEASGDVVVEPGAGPGYYLAAVLAHRGLPARGVATDLSAYACRRSAKLPRVGAVVADTWAGLPVRNRVADTVLTVFAPRNWAEFARICAPGGRILVVTPLPDHLAEVRRTRGLLTIEEGKHERLLTDARAASLVHEGHRNLTYPITLSARQEASLIGMGPNAFHATAAGNGHSDSNEIPAQVTVSVRLDSFVHPQGGPASRRSASVPPDR